MLKCGLYDVCMKIMPAYALVVTLVNKACTLNGKIMVGTILDFLSINFRKRPIK